MWLGPGARVLALALTEDCVSCVGAARVVRLHGVWVHAGRRRQGLAARLVAHLHAKTLAAGAQPALAAKPTTAGGTALMAACLAAHGPFLFVGFWWAC